MFRKVRTSAWRTVAPSFLPPLLSANSMRAVWAIKNAWVWNVSRMNANDTEMKHKRIPSFVSGTEFGVEDRDHARGQPLASAATKDTP